MFDFARYLAPLRTRVVNMVARAVVKAIDDEKKIQLLQIAVLKDELRADVERIQNYGFTSHPKTGAEAAVIFVGGSRDHGLVIAVDDRRYRLHLESGEVAMYDHTGSKIVMKTNGDIEATPSSGLMKVVGDLSVSGDIDGDGDISAFNNLSAGNDVTAGGDVIAGSVHLKGHTHPYTDADTASGGSGGPKDTGPPS